jgi:hypothetical protein
LWDPLINFFCRPLGPHQKPGEDVTVAPHQALGFEGPVCYSATQTARIRGFRRNFEELVTNGIVALCNRARPSLQPIFVFLKPHQVRFKSRERFLGEACASPRRSQPRYAALLFDDHLTSFVDVSHYRFEKIIVRRHVSTDAD